MGICVWYGCKCSQATDESNVYGCGYDGENFCQEEDIDEIEEGDN